MRGIWMFLFGISSHPCGTRSDGRRGLDRYFNVNGACFSDEHYMVDLTSRLVQIRKLVDNGKYFVINRARQYGKTTILWALKQYLREEYTVVFLSFQRISAAKFRNENVFSAAFAKNFMQAAENDPGLADPACQEAINELKKDMKNADGSFELMELFSDLSRICKLAAKPMILMIDEVDSASNNQVFVDFLGMLRDYYLSRKITPVFHSVILAGVYDIKNLKQKIHPEEDRRYNSPWNIAADFDIDMSFSVKEIEEMLREYEADHKTGMDCSAAAVFIYEYTSGYPYLVSRICKLVDEKIAGGENYPDKQSAWTKEGIKEAVKALLMESNTLFESLTGRLSDHPRLKELLYSLLFTGKSVPYNPLNDSLKTAEMFGFIKNKEGNVAVANRIFETVLYNLFLSEEALDSGMYKAGLIEKNQFIRNGRLDMSLVLQKFVLYFDDLYGDQNITFLEEAGRRYFLLYLRPIINGAGNYYIEARTRNMERTDVIVDYQGEQFVIELKIWHGNTYNERGERQLADYLDYYHLKKGYMLSFNFNKRKQIGVKEITIGDKVLVEAVV